MKYFSRNCNNNKKRRATQFLRGEGKKKSRLLGATRPSITLKMKGMLLVLPVSQRCKGSERSVFFYYVKSKEREAEREGGECVACAASHQNPKSGRKPLPLIPFTDGCST